MLISTLTPPTYLGLHDLLTGCAHQEADPARRQKWVELACAVNDLCTTGLTSEPLPGNVWHQVTAPTKWACQTCGEKVAFAGALACSEECDRIRIHREIELEDLS